MTNETTEHLAIAVDIYLTTPKGQSGLILERLFPDDEVVHDDGRNYVGLDAIGAWSQSAAAAFFSTRTIADVTRRVNAAIVRARGKGTSPGSPVNLHHHFLLADEGSAH